MQSDHELIGMSTTPLTACAESGTIRSIDRTRRRSQCDTPIGASIERIERALAGRPDFGIGTSHSVTTLTDGLRCTSEEGSWRIEADLSDRLGGDGSAPTPSGAPARPALGSCMAMTYRLRAPPSTASRSTSIRVTVETESAIAGMLLPDSNEPAGFRAVRFHVEVESPVPAAVVMRILDEGDRLSPVLDVFTTGVAVQRSVSITTTPTRVEVA